MTESQLVVEDRTCSGCKHFSRRTADIPICRKHHMGVTTDMRVTYKASAGTCFEDKTEPRKGPSLEILVKWAEELCEQHWGIPSTCRIVLSNRIWIQRNGQFVSISSPDGRPYIEFSKKRNAERTPEQVKGTLLHELVHWRLYTLKLPHRDRNKEFVAECLRVGAPISKARVAQQAYQRYMQSIGEVAIHG